MGKKMNKLRSSYDTEKLYPVKEAVDLVKSLSYVNFDPTMDVSINLGVDPRHSNQVVRGVVSLPAGTGKLVRVAVICKDEKAKIAKDAGADLVGGLELIDTIKSGTIDFDICIATPDMMGLVGQVARILGPKGLMPNPKLGTVTQDVETAVKNAKAGQVEFRVEKAGIIHAGLGKLSFDSNGLLSNFMALFDAVVKAKPSEAKGAYIKSVYLSSTMGPAVKVDVSSMLK